jgi:hypothetical protein
MFSWDEVLVLESYWILFPLKMGNLNGFLEHVIFLMANLSSDVLSQNFQVLLSIENMKITPNDKSFPFL